MSRLSSKADNLISLGKKNLFQTFEELESVKDIEADTRAIHELLFDGDHPRDEREPETNIIRTMPLEKVSMPLTELHIHFQGCIRPASLLGHLAKTENVLWDWYESEYKAAYGFVPPTRQLVERYRNGDTSVVKENPPTDRSQQGDLSSFLWSCF